MNYYERHLGDYAKDTVHLSMLEDGAYNRLLDRYYATESPIPTDQAHRVARARTKEEREAVDIVLREFFLLTDGGWVNRRADEEIEKARVRIDTAKANGRRGGRPRKNPAGSEVGTQQKPNGFSLGSGNETQSKAHQTPDTRHQTPPEKQKPESTDVDLFPGSDEPENDTPAGVPPCPVKRIVEAYHRALPQLAPVKELPEVSVRMLRARWRSDPERQTVTWWEGFFAYVGRCPFLVGEKTDFQADLLWLVRPTNFAKVVNGNYEERAA